MPSSKLRRGMVVWVELGSTLGREQAGRRPALVVASDAFLRKADTLAMIVPATTVDRGWPNHVQLSGPGLDLDSPIFAMTEQFRTISRSRIVGQAGVVSVGVMREVDRWLRDFLALP